MQLTLETMITSLRSSRARVALWRSLSNLNFLAYQWSLRSARLDEAEALLTKALKQRPFSGAYQDSMGWVLVQQGKPEAALDFLERAVRYLPDEAEVLEHLADAYSAAGRVRQAVARYTEALKAAEAADDGRIPPERLREKLRTLEAQGAQVGHTP